MGGGFEACRKALHKREQWQRLREEDLGEREVLARALGLASCPRLFRITGQAHVPATMAQRLPRTVVVMPLWAEFPQHVLSSVKRWHMRV